MVLLDEGASPCECHVIDDTTCFLTIVILPPGTVTVRLQIHFRPLPSLSFAQAHTHTSPQPHVVVSSSTLSALSIHKDLSLDSVRMVLLDEGASPCECHVNDDTPCFLTIVILPPGTLTVQLQIHFRPLPSLSYAQAHTHTSPQPHVVASSSTLSALSTHKDLSLDSVRMVLLDDGASLCESSAWTLLGWYC